MVSSGRRRLPPLSSPYAMGRYSPESLPSGSESVLIASSMRVEYWEIRLMIMIFGVWEQIVGIAVTETAGWRTEARNQA